QADGSYDFHPMLENLKTWTDGYDLCYYNQESILGGTKLGLSSYPMFNSPQEVGDAMTDNGFNLVSLANNHSLDRGVSGIESSMKYWNSKEQVVHAGTSLSEEERDSIPVYEVNGISYCFLSWTYGCNGLYPPSDMPYLVNIYTDHEEELLEQVREADQKADLVIVAMHWGVEYTLEPVQEVKDLAQQLADAGADLIIGNHPHVIEPIEYFGDTLCFYSFGNLIAAQLDTEDRIGMIGAVTVTKTVQPDGETEISLSDARADLTFICYDSNIRNFKVVLMRDLDDSQLADHEAIYDKYQKVLTQYDGRIQIGMK
ncbi:MAG: CapA family protein, partial [Stecheria intestinalis]|nr:CapA family protein [Stecheria intestinalis]